MNIKSTLLICIVVILLGAFTTNPNKEDYINWSKEQLTSKLDDGLEKGLINLIGGPLLKSSTISKNLIFFSIYETSFGSNESVKVLGAFNNFLPISSNIQDKQNQQT